jgi:hypothetical protein
MNTTIKIVVVSTISFAAGYGFCKKVLEQSYQDITDADHADLKKHYEDRLAKDMLEYEEYLARGDEKAALTEPDRRVFESTPEEPVIGSQREYDESLTRYQVGEAAAYLERPSAIVTASEDFPAPFVLTEEEFMRGDMSWPQSTLTYYEIDNVLADEKDEEVTADTRAKAIGNCVNNFGEGSNDPSVVYVRSPALQHDYELIKSEGSFSKEVLGLGDEAP